MLTKLLDFVIGREPVATATGIAAIVTATLGVLAAFGADITAEQIAAIGALAAALAGWLGRKAVTPVTTPTTRRLARADPLDTVEGDSRMDGSIPLALLILAGLFVVMMAGLAVCGDAMFEDEQEKDDLGIELISHEYCAADHDCGGWGGGGSDGNTGYDGEGGRSGDYDGGPGDDCRNACGNYIVVPDPRGGDDRQPQSLFPPTPDAVRQFVLATIKSGIEMGRLFAETTIRFVENLLIGIA